MFILHVTEEAQEEARVAYFYYEEQEKGLGERFLSVLAKRFHDLAEHPEYYSYISDHQPSEMSVSVPFLI